MKLYFSHTLPGRDGARSLLAQAAREVWGWAELPALDRASNGKPFFPSHPHHHFNLSHSGPYALCALSSSPVGADIQVVKDSLNPRLPGRVCSPEQLAWLEQQPDPHRAFTLLWCLKEAQVKYTGQGLGAGLRTVPIPLPVPGQSLYRHENLWFRIYEGADFFAAVCGEEEPPEMKTVDTAFPMCYPKLSSAH